MGVQDQHQGHRRDTRTQCVDEWDKLEQHIINEAVTKETLSLCGCRSRTVWT